MEAKEFLDILHLAEKLKNNTRHSWTSEGRRESVAEHSWRLALMALLACSEMPELDANRVVTMCLVDDLGEAFTGDIPAFEKTEAQEEEESRRLAAWVSQLPAPWHDTLSALLAEMDALETPEAKAYRALDKMEAVLQHNEAPLSTWLPLEYVLNQEYGQAEAQAAPFLAAVRRELERETQEKVAAKTP